MSRFARWKLRTILSIQLLKAHTIQFASIKCELTKCQQDVASCSTINSDGKEEGNGFMIVLCFMNSVAINILSLTHRKFSLSKAD